MKRLAVLYERITGKQTILAAVIFILFTATILPWVSNYTAEIIGVSESIDTNFNFNLNNIYDIMDRYGESGRRFYIMMRWTFDVVWPMVYTLFLVTTTAYLAKKIDCKLKEKILYVALLAMCFDFLENIIATGAMLIYPIKHDFLIYMLIVASLLKWLILGGAFILLGFLLIRVIYRLTKK